jgi:hypothetical protein
MYGSWAISFAFLTIGISGNWLASLPGLFTRGEGDLESPYMGDKRTSKPVGTLWKQNCHLTGIEPGLFGRPGSTPIAVPSDLSHLTVCVLAPDSLFCMLQSYDTRDSYNWFIFQWSVVDTVIVCNEVATKSLYNLYASLQSRLHNQGLVTLYMIASDATAGGHVTVRFTPDSGDICSPGDICSLELSLLILCVRVFRLLPPVVEPFTLLRCYAA